ncbi:MAG: peptidyl-prolyl cis-trans isomerase [Paracoccaceae bacterium]
MSTPLRRKRANSVIWGVLALMMVGLGGYGVTNFSQSVTDIGAVGDRAISTNEYGRALKSELNAISAQMQKPISFQQAQEQGIDKAVLAQLVSAASLEDEANKLGVSVGDAQIRDRIMSAQALKGIDGKFNRDNYTLYLKQQGLSEAEFEGQMRAEAARTILQGAVLGGIAAPASVADRFAAWVTETRSFTFAELIASDLAAPIGAPTDADIKAWYDAHNDAYMRPETRKLTYVWLSPDDLVAQVPADEAALKAAYDQRKSEFIIPEKRLVARLVFPSEAEAEAARKRLDAGQASFEDLVKERGLTTADADLGEVSRDELGKNADAVFALTEPGVVGPLDTDLGPALFAMNAVLAAQETTFEEAKADLQSEVALDRARRMVSDKSSSIEDLLAGGATLEEVAKEAGMQIGQLDFNSESEGGLVGYEAFRKAATEITADSYPSLVGLDDGGVFALRLDGIDPPALRPLDEVKGKVIADWTADATHKALVDLAAEKMAELDNGVSLEGLGLVTTSYDDFARNGFVADTPPELGKAVFEMTAGTHKVVDAGGKVYLLSVTAITPADTASDDYKAQRARIESQLSQSVGRDVFDAYTRALQTTVGINLNTAAINAVNAQMQ